MHRKIKGQSSSIHTKVYFRFHALRRVYIAQAAPISIVKLKKVGLSPCKRQESVVCRNACELKQGYRLVEKETRTCVLPDPIIHPYAPAKMNRAALFFINV